MRIGLLYILATMTVTNLLMGAAPDACSDENLPRVISSEHTINQESRERNGQALLAYLARPSLSYQCARLAIDQLGEMRYEKAVPTLTSYLWMEEPQVMNGDGVLYRRSSGPYVPAVEALYAIGKSALPGIIGMLSMPNQKGEIRKRAVLLMVSITGDDIGVVKMLNDKNRASNDPSVSARLLDAARIGVTYCHSERRHLCDQVLYDQSKE